MRWARILRELGHRVRVEGGEQHHDADMLIAIHAYRSAHAIEQWAQRCPDRPLIVLLAGTDIYRFQHSDAKITLNSMRVADRLVGLHDLVGDDIPAQFANKLRIIHQSSTPLAKPRHATQRYFDICVVGHLREEKDPLRAALAARQLPCSSKIRILHYGKAHNEQWAQQAHDEMASNPRYLWKGEIPPAQVRRAFGRCQAMVMSSVMEGGANVVSEAIVAGLPVLASDISGNLGLLGARHPAYYPVQNTAALAELLLRAENERGFLQQVQQHASTRAGLFEPQLEAQAWADLLAEFK